MNTAKKMVVAGIALALGVSTAANAAQQKEEDSVYKWGRWAVLSPAAGGEPYVAPLTPDSVNNARPGEADEFQPQVQVVIDTPIQPPVAVPNPPGNPPPSGNPRGFSPPPAPPVAVPNPLGNPPPSGNPRGFSPPPASRLDLAP